MLEHVRLDHVVIAVSDWDRSIRFYRDVMGAQVVDHPDGRVAFRFGDQQLNVHGPGVDAGTLVASPPVAPGGSDLCFAWPGTLDELSRHLAAHGVVVEDGPVVRYGGAGAGTSTYFRDPDGSLLEYIVYSSTEPSLRQFRCRRENPLLAADRSSSESTATRGVQNDHVCTW